MTQLKNPTAGGTPSGVELHIDDLTRDQRTVLGRLTHRFRETAVAQVLVGPPETGKTTIAEMVGQCLEEQVETVHLSKSLDPNGSQKRMMFEAYGSYSHLLSAILKQLGFFARGEEPDLVEQLVEQLHRLRSEDKRLLVIIDDAEDMNPAVWKRFQSWLDFQDRGVRMIQVMLIGKPILKKKLAEPAMRAWRRWVQGTYELHLIGRWGANASEEAHRMLKRACESINAKTQPTQPIRPPRVTWAAVQKIVKEAGGRPGRMNELVKRALSASIREGGRSIGYRFLLRADALRSPAMQWYKLRRAGGATPEKAPAPVKRKFFFTSRGKAMKERTQNPRVPEHPLGWMRYALGTLLVVFALGAGWGITSWLSIENQTSDSFLLAEESTPLETITSVSASGPMDDPWGSPGPLEPENIDSPFTLASSEPLDGYPLEDLLEPEGTLAPIAGSQLISASLEQEFQKLEAKGLEWAEAAPPREPFAPLDVLSGDTVQPPPTETVKAETENLATVTSTGLDSLEDFELPAPRTGLGEVVKTESEPISAEGFDLPENLVNQTASIGTLSVPPPTQSPSPPKRSTAAPAPTSRSNTTASKPAAEPAPGGKQGSRERLLEAMSRLEKSLK